MITTAEMKELEDNCGISKLQLMENAGKGIYNVIKERYPELKGKRILIVAYQGNNGGDGFVAARLLCEECETEVLFIGDETKLKTEAEVNYRKIEKNDWIQVLIDEEQVDFDEYDIIMDAILGTGVSGAISGQIANVIEMINNSKAFKIAIDVPTGINPDTGEEANAFVNADLIITFHDIKKGLERFQDKTVVVDIGIPKLD